MCNHTFIYYYDSEIFMSNNVMTNFNKSKCSHIVDIWLVSCGKIAIILKAYILYHLCHLDVHSAILYQTLMIFELANLNVFYYAGGWLREIYGICRIYWISSIYGFYDGRCRGDTLM